jgi:hypothetical protein
VVPVQGDPGRILLDTRYDWNDQLVEGWVDLGRELKKKYCEDDEERWFHNKSMK